MLQYSYPSDVRVIDPNYSRMWEFLFQIHSSCTTVCREKNNCNEWTPKDGDCSRLVACGLLIPVFIFRNTFVAWNIKKSVVWSLMIADTAPHFFCGVNVSINELIFKSYIQFYTQWSCFSSKTALFWVITQRVGVILYQNFGTIYQLSRNVSEELPQIPL